jgi:DNA-directed RNA polymerase subunit M/transcription elongation factor TFIIS
MRRELWTTIVSVTVVVMLGALAADAIAALPDRDEGRPAKERDGERAGKGDRDREGDPGEAGPRDGERGADAEKDRPRDGDREAGPGDQGREGAEGEQAFEAKHQFPAPYDRMTVDCKLSETQQDKLHKLIEQRDKRLELFDKRIERQTEAIDRQQDPERRKAAQGSLERLREQRKGIEDQVEMQAVNAVLTPDQKGIWYGQKLEPMVAEEFRAIDLTSEQREKLTEVCREVGKRVRSVEDKYAKPAIAQASSRIFSTVLDQEQKVTYAKAKREEAQREKAERSSRFRQRQQREGDEPPPR